MLNTNTKSKYIQYAYCVSWCMRCGVFSKKKIYTISFFKRVAKFFERKFSILLVFSYYSYCWVNAFLFSENCFNSVATKILTIHPIPLALNPFVNKGKQILVHVQSFIVSYLTFTRQTIKTNYIQVKANENITNLTYFTIKKSTTHQSTATTIFGLKNHLNSNLKN